MVNRQFVDDIILYYNIYFMCRLYIKIQNMVLK